MNTEGTFRIAFWVLLALVFVMRGYFSFRVRQAGERLLPDEAAIKREGQGMFAIRVVAFLLLITWLVLYAINPRWMQVLGFPLPGWLRWAGFVLGLVSLGLWFWAQVELDTQWSAQLQLRKEHHLVTSGPYARMRHPLYTAMCGWGMSLALVTANWVFVAMAVAVFAVFFARVPREEQMMIERFGDQYRVYMKKAGRFFPRFFSK
jgi:protein-S-isoprenylcysteine O-methyltransferase Ste14